MKPDKDPVIVNLAERRKAARQAEAVARKSVKTTSKEPLLGRRPRAGLILALWLLPKLF